MAEDLEPIISDLLPTLTLDYCSDYTIDVHQVTKRLLNINVYKATGPDFLPNWILRDLAKLIAEPLTAVFKASVREGIVPDIWKSAIVIPAPEVHPPKTISSDLRPISLLPVLGKILESFVADWLCDFLAPTLDPNQFGGLKIIDKEFPDLL